MPIEPTPAISTRSATVRPSADLGPAPAVGPGPALAAAPAHTALALSVPHAPAASVVPEPEASPGAWQRIAVEAAAARDEVAATLAAGLDAPGLLDGLARAASTLGWVQRRIEAGIAPGDRAALASVVAARSSVQEARGLVSGALVSCSAGAAGTGRLHH